MTDDFGNRWHNRRSIRLRGFDYSGAGHYFVTVCTWSREFLFGCIRDGRMDLNEGGQAVEKCWRQIPAHFPHAESDEFVVMSNHVHGIIVIAHTVGTKNFSPLPCGGEATPVPFRSPEKNLGSIVRGFKIGVTKWFRSHTEVYSVWQRNYFDHAVRDLADLERIRRYIRANPGHWIDDPENSVNAGHPMEDRS